MNRSDQKITSWIYSFSFKFILIPTWIHSFSFLHEGGQELAAWICSFSFLHLFILIPIWRRPRVGCCGRACLWARSIGRTFRQVELGDHGKRMDDVSGSSSLSPPPPPHQRNSLVIWSPLWSSPAILLLGCFISFSFVAIVTVSVPLLLEFILRIDYQDPSVAIC